VAPEGSRRLQGGFFDDHKRFYDTSDTSALPWRLNLRHEAIIGENLDVIRGRRVLDLASHDGRWALAAAKAGASAVTGVEARADLVDLARQNATHYGADPGSVDFVVDDVFHYLAETKVDADVILCLGFLYHTLRFSELMSLLRRSNASTLIIDTMLDPHVSGPYVRVRAEPVERQGNAVADDYSHGDVVLVGRPSLRGLRVMMEAYGFEITHMSDWASLLRDNPEADGISDYRQGRRATLTVEARPTGASPD
jgi:hypothetical protein